MRLLLFTADAAFLSAAIVIASAAFGWRILGSAMMLAGTLALFAFYRLYDARRAERASSVADLPRVANALSLWGLFMAAADSASFGLDEIIVTVPLAAAFVLVGRATARSIARTYLPPERAVILASSEHARAIVDRLTAHPEYRVKPAAMIDPTASNDQTWMAQIKAVDAQRALICDASFETDMLLEVVRECMAEGVVVDGIPLPRTGPVVHAHPLAGFTLLRVHDTSLSPVDRAVKRVVDIVGAMIGLALAAPVMALIATAIKFDSSGPVFFTQPRLGRHGQPFDIVKFRTMTHLVGNPETAQEHVQATRVGEWLRTTSLNELPQLWNVLKGEMSLVGPRPSMVGSHEAALVGWADHRLQVRPGLTGLWQITGRKTIPAEEMVNLDDQYVTSWSLWRDIRLLIQTVPAVVSKRGAD